MQIKTEKMKNQKTERPNGKRDHFRHINKVKTITRKHGRKAKQFMQNAS